MADQTINLSAGALEYTFPVTIVETSGKDISSDSVQISLGKVDEPGVWVVPDVITHPTTSKIVVKLLVGGSLRPDPGTYYVWVKVTDSPEVVPRRSPDKTKIV